MTVQEYLKLCEKITRVYEYHKKRLTYLILNNIKIYHLIYIHVDVWYNKINK